jgi:tight adherence protein B
MSATLPAAVAAASAALAVALAWPAAPHGAVRRCTPLVAASGATAVLVVAGPPAPIAGPLVVAALAGLGAMVVLRRRARSAAAARTRTRALGFCDELAAGLAAGLPPSTAMESAAEAWPAVQEVTAVARLGGSVPSALRHLAERPGAGDLRQVAAAWQVAHRSGASLAQALGGVVEALREQQSTRRLVASELASARATARLMAGLPVATLLLGSGTGGSPVGFLLSTPAGLLCLSAGLGLAVLGLWWIEAIADAVEREVP